MKIVRCHVIGPRQYLFEAPDVRDDELVEIKFVSNENRMAKKVRDITPEDYQMIFAR